MFHCTDYVMHTVAHACSVFQTNDVLYLLITIHRLYDQRGHTQIDILQAGNQCNTTRQAAITRVSHSMTQPALATATQVLD